MSSSLILRSKASSNMRFEALCTTVSELPTLLWKKIFHTSIFCMTSIFGSMAICGISNGTKYFIFSPVFQQDNVRSHVAKVMSDFFWEVPNESSLMTCKFTRHVLIDHFFYIMGKNLLSFTPSTSVRSFPTPSSGC